MTSGPSAGSPQRLSPLRDRYPDTTVHADIDAATVPWTFTGVAQEYSAIRHAAARIDLSSAGILDVRGPGAYDLLQAALARDIEFVTPEQSLACLILDADGDVVDQVTAYLTDDGFRLQTSFGRAPATAAHLEQLGAQRGDDAEIIDLDGELTLISVEGPLAAVRLEALLDPDLGALPLGGVLTVEFAAEGEPTDIIVARTGFTGEFGYTLFVPTDQAGALWDALGELAPAGLAALEIAMIEVRQPVLHRELDAGRSPLALGYNWLIDITKEEFCGREAVEAAFESGARSEVIGWCGAAATPPEPGTEVTLDGVAVGTTMYAVFSPSRGELVGLARVRPDLVAPGIDLTIGSGAGAVRAATAAAPYVIPSSWTRAGDAASEVAGPGSAAATIEAAAGALRQFIQPETGS